MIWYIMWVNHNVDNDNNNNDDDDNDDSNNDNDNIYDNYNINDKSMPWYIMLSNGYFFSWRWGSIVPQFPRTRKQDTW